MPPHSTNNFILYKLILLVNRNILQKLFCCLLHAEVLQKIKYVLQPRASYNLNKHLRLTAGNVTITFFREFDYVSHY